MNDLELDRIGRDAAARTRADASRIADSKSALAELLAGEPMRVATAPPPSAPSRRPTWVLLAAAATIVVVIAGVAAVNRGGDETPAVSTNPTLGTMPPVDETVPHVTEPIAPTPDTMPDTTPATAPPATSTTIAPITDPADTVEIADAVGEPLGRRVLATYTTGGGDGQLGYEQCQECDPLRAWRPVVTPDGALVVADAVNQRWQVFRDGAWTAVPYADGLPIAGSPVVGPDGYVYALRADGLGQGNPRHVAAFDPTTLDLVAKYDGGPPGYWSVDLVNGQIEVGGRTVVELGTPLGMPTWTIDWETNRVTIAISGIAREFQLPATWHASYGGVAALDDGSVVLQVWSVPADTPNADSTNQWLVLRLWADGTYAVGTTATNASTSNLDVSFSPTGMVQLEDGEIVEYAYPQFGGDDPLAAWSIPESVSASLDDVPRLLPAELPEAARSLSRGEYEGDPGPPHGYLQTWVRADASGTVEDYVQIDTMTGPSLLGDSDGDVTVPGWKRAYFVRSEAPYETLRAHTATRTMTVWSSGLGRDEVAALAAGLTADTDGAGWSAPGLVPDDGWTLVSEGWATPGASRGVTALRDDDSIVLELSATWGIPSMITGPQGLGTTAELSEIDGHPALVYDAGHAWAVTWSPEPDLVVTVGLAAPAHDLLEVARSLVDTDQETWDAIPSRQGDGCSSLFC